MSLICYICQLVHVQISDNYVWIYTSYGLTVINNVTMSNGVYMFHIIVICPSTNMPAILHIHVALLKHCTLSIDPTLLHTQVKTTTNCNF